jgi:excisionase family DNA binding protein
MEGTNMRKVDSFDELLTVEEAAARLGLKQVTIRAWILRRRIGFVKLNGRSVRIPAEELSRLVSAGFIPAAPR